MCLGYLAFWGVRFLGLLVILRAVLGYFLMVGWFWVISVALLGLGFLTSLLGFGRWFGFGTWSSSDFGFGVLRDFDVGFEGFGLVLMFVF